MKVTRKQETVQAAIGLIIRKAREAQGLTQSEMCGFLGCSEGWFSKLENGKFPSLSVEWFLRVCDALNLDPSRVIAHAKKHRHA